MDLHYEALLARLFLNDDEIAEAARRIHASPTRTQIITTGAGAGLQNVLWQQPNLSKTLFESRFPYDRIPSTDLLGHEPDGHCTPEVARAFATAAFHQAREYAVRGGDAHPDVIGLGLTAAVRRETPMKGEHRAFVAYRTGERIYEIALHFTKGFLTRKQEGELCDAVAVLGLDRLVTLANPHEDREYDFGILEDEIESVLRAHDGVTFRLHAECTRVTTLRDEGHAISPGMLFKANDTRWTTEQLDPEKHILFPGSFNPVHHAHLFTAYLAEHSVNKKVVYLMNMAHPDKVIGGDVNGEMLRRAEQFRWYRDVLFTDKSLFIEMAERYKGFSFLMGADVVKGILNPKYYPGSSVEAVLAKFRSFGTTFLVNGRQDRETGKFETLKDLPVPPQFADLFTPVAGRVDAASRDLR